MNSLGEPELEDEWAMVEGAAQLYNFRDSRDLAAQLHPSRMDNFSEEGETLRQRIPSLPPNSLHEHAHPGVSWQPQACCHMLKMKFAPQFAVEGAWWCESCLVSMRGVFNS